MSIIKITVNDQDLVVTQKPVIASEGIEEDVVKFTFSSEWTNMGKTAVFFNASDKDTIYTAAVDANGEAVVPWEATQKDGAFYIGVYGTITGGTVLTSNLIRYNLEKGIYTEGSQSEPPTPSIVTQFMSLVGQLQNATDVLDARLDAVEASSGSDGSVVLYGGDDLANKAQYTETTYTLSQAAENFAYIDIYMSVHGSTQIKTIPAPEPLASGETAKLWTLTGNFIAAYGDNAAMFATFMVTFEGTTFTIGMQQEWTEAANGTIQRDIIHSAADEIITNTYIYKIVGRNEASAEELADIRIGFDGTVYGSAGTAVRAQAETVDAKAEIARSNVVQSIEAHDGYKIITFEPGGYYNTPAVGTVVDITTPTASANYLHAITGCEPGDKFTVNLYGGTSNARGYAFLDEDKKALNRPTANAHFQTVLTAPADAAYLVMNTKVSESEFYAFTGEVPVTDLVPESGSDNLVKSGGVFLTNDRIEDVIGETATAVSLNYTSGKYWDSTTDTATLGDASGYAAFDQISVTPGEKYRVKTMYNGAASYRPILITDSNLKILNKHTTANTSSAVTYDLYIPDGAAYMLLTSTAAVAPSAEVKKLTLDSLAKASDIASLAGMFDYNGANIAIIGDSISTNGNYSASNPGGNMPEIIIGSEDVGATLSAYATYYDIGTTVGGHTITADDVGTEITFTPVADDIGKFVGVPKNNNAASTVVWWEVAQEALGFNAIPVCWSGSSITSHEGTDEELATSYAWHPAQIRKCGIRTPGTMTRTAPDMVIIFRGANDFSHSPYTRLTDDYFSAEWRYPETDVVTDGFGFLEGLCLTVKKLREAYPMAKIVLCTFNYFQRFNSTRPGYPTRNGINTLNEYNNAVRAAADWLGCGLIEFDKDGLTYENASSTYYNETTGNYTHPNTAGQAFLGKRAICDLARIND